MLKLTLANEDTVDIDKNTDNCIRNNEHLNSIFSGNASIYYVDEDQEGPVYVDPEDIVFHPENAIKTEGDPSYQRITKAEWDFKTGHETIYGGYRTNSWEAFVEDEMNKYSQTDANWCYDVINQGCATGCVKSLVYKADILKILVEHSIDLEHEIREIGKRFGDGSFMDFSEFNFSNLVWMCFEEKIREVLNNLDLEDV